MAIQPQPLSEQEHRAIICVCILAAFADGAQDEVERAQIERIVNGFPDEHLDLASAYQDILGGKLSLAQVVGQLQAPSAKALAYEMAVCVCHANGLLQEPEKRFLADLRQALQLDSSSVDEHQQTVQAMVAQPLAGSAPPVLDANREAELDHLILNAGKTVLRQRAHSHHRAVEGSVRLDVAGSTRPAGPLFRGHRAKVSTGEYLRTTALGQVAITASDISPWMSERGIADLPIEGIRSITAFSRRECFLADVAGRPTPS